MIQASSEAYLLGDAAAVGAARRAVRSLVARLGLPETDAAPAELALTELATNVERHAGGDGYALLRTVAEERGIEILVVDRGPGTSAPAPALGAASPSGGLGIGLDSVRRLASSFELYAPPGKGRVTLARFSFDDSPTPLPIAYAGVSVPVLPLDVNGDGWAVTIDEGGCTVLVVDGLGHGPGAHRAAQAALRTFEEGFGRDICSWFPRAHEVMRGTRGGVAGIARIDIGRRVVTFAGVGNVTGSVVLDGSSRALLSRPGVLGTEHRLPSPYLMETPWTADSALVLWTDGLKSRITLDGHPGLLDHDPALVAALLHRDFAKGNDDATVVVVRETSGRPEHTE